MATKAFSGSDIDRQAAAPLPKEGSVRVSLAVLLALGASTLVALILPPMAFHARAMVSVADMMSPLSAMLSRAAADAAVSEPVIRRAAESLIGTDLAIPPPGVIEQIEVAIGFEGAHATGQAARLAADLASIVTAKPGDVPGSVEIAADSSDARHAAQIATAIADALVADHEDIAAQARRSSEVDAIAIVDRLKAEAASARRRLAALGGVETDPLQARAAAAVQTANAQARLDTIAAIIASGAPPLSDRRDVPAGIETLQTNYLDLARQLAKARETLGDRHTTIISLQAEVKHAAASLMAEWGRLRHLAETELATAHQREAMLRKGDTGADAKSRDAIEDARRGVQIADDKVARVQTAQRETPIDEHGYRLMAQAAIPMVAAGVSTPLRALLAGLAGLVAFAIGLRLPSPADMHARLSVLRARRHDVGPSMDRETVDDDAIAARHAMKRRTKTMWSARDAATDVDPDEALMRSLSDLLPRLDDVSSTFGAVPTILVAANETAADTMPVALALGRVAADVGHRVLLVEVARARPELATAADADADPVLIDLYGVLRVALRAAVSDGFLYLAPSLEHGARIASALARHSDTPLVDDIAAEFDLIVIDGGRAADSAAAGWGADAYIRVGRFPAQRDDDQFAAAFGVSKSALLGTIVTSAFAPKQRQQAARGPSVLDASLSRQAMRPPGHSPAPQPRAMPGRPVARRKMAAR